VDDATSLLQSGSQVYGEAGQNMRGQGGCQPLVDSGELLGETWEKLTEVTRFDCSSRTRVQD
jgi:hypothetical protein